MLDQSESGGCLFKGMPGSVHPESPTPSGLKAPLCQVACPRPSTKSYHDCVMHLPVPAVQGPREHLGLSKAKATSRLLWQNISGSGPFGSWISILYWPQILSPYFPRK